MPGSEAVTVRQVLQDGTWRKILAVEYHHVIMRALEWHTESPKAGQSRPLPVGIKQSGKATFA